MQMHHQERARVGAVQGVNPLLRCNSSRKSKQSSCYSPNRSSTKPPHVFQQNVKIKGRDCVQVFGLNVKKKNPKTTNNNNKADNYIKVNTIVRFVNNNNNKNYLNCLGILCYITNRYSNICWKKNQACSFIHVVQFAHKRAGKKVL